MNSFLSFRVASQSSGATQSTSLAGQYGSVVDYIRPCERLLKDFETDLSPGFLGLIRIRPSTVSGLSQANESYREGEIVQRKQQADREDGTHSHKQLKTKIFSIYVRSLTELNTCWDD